MKWHKRFFWLLLLFLPTQLGFHFWPEWAMVLGRRVDYLSPTLYVTDILIVITTITWFLSSRDRSDGVAISHFMRLLRGARNDRERNTRIVIITTLLLAAVNIFMAANQIIALYKWIKVSEFVFLGWYIVRTKPRLSFIITPLSIGVLYSSVLAIAQFFLQHSVGGPMWWLGERTFTVDTPGIARIALGGRELLRPYGTFSHPNVLGGFLAVVLPLMVVRKKAKFFYGTVILVGIIALLLTFSRSAIVVGAVAILLTLLFCHSRESGNPVFILKWIPGQARNDKKKIVFIVGFLFFLSLVMYRIFPIDPSSESVVVRQQLNIAAVKLWQTSPLFGVGLGNFLVRLPEALPSRTIYFLQPVHNIYLLLLSEVGIVGILLIVLFGLWVSNYEFRIINQGNKQNKETYMIHASLFIILILGLVDHYSLTLQQGQLLLVLLIAMCLIYTRRHDQKRLSSGSHMV